MPTSFTPAKTEEARIRKEHVGGLLFPNDEEPDYQDFAYFAFVIGMTFQVSDVQITSGNIHRPVLLHGILSFTYNTIIVTLSINIISGLIQKIKQRAYRIRVGKGRLASK